MALQRIDPFRDLRNWETTMNRLWRGFGETPSRREHPVNGTIAVDIIQKPEETLVNASLPGVKPEDIDVTIEDNVLTVKAERRDEHQEEDSRYLVRERSYGRYYRALRLPDTVDVSKVTSNFEGGVLTITLPKAEEKKPKQIKVGVGVNKEIAASTAKKK